MALSPRLHRPRGQRRQPLRPGYQNLLDDARGGQFDIVVAEALDRLSRDQHVPELRIVADDLWHAVKARQKSLRSTRTGKKQGGYWDRRRRTTCSRA